MHIRKCCFAARAELRDDHRQRTAAGTRQSDASKMSTSRTVSETNVSPTWEFILVSWGAENWQEMIRGFQEVDAEYRLA